MNAKRVLDVLAAVSVGDGVLWVIAPRRRGFLWMIGPKSFRNLMDQISEERPWIARSIGATQAIVSVWVALRYYPEP